MNKDQVKEIIKTSIQQNVISREEVISIAGGTGTASGSQSGAIGGIGKGAEKESILPKVLYSIGGVIAVTGVLVLLGNNWDAIGFVGRWLATVGFGLATFIAAFMVYKKSEYNVLSQVFFAISAVASFIGGFVWLGESGLAHLDGPDAALTVSSVLLVVFAAALYAARKGVLHIIATALFTVAYYSLVSKFLKGSGFSLMALKDIMVYASMILAIGYFMYGSWITKGAFTADLSVSGRRLFLGGVWNFLYAFIAIGAVILSVKLKTKIGLIVTSIAIGIYCIKISVQYFADSISFSLALLVSGLLIIALGYLTYYLNKKYITGQSN